MVCNCGRLYLLLIPILFEYIELLEATTICGPKYMRAVKKNKLYPQETNV